MHQRFTQNQIARLKREAKAIQSAGLDAPLHSALNQVAAQYGYRNWSLLMKNSVSDEQASEQFKLTIAPYPGGHDGVYIVQIEIIEPSLLKRVQTASPFFDLPDLPDWMIMAATKRGKTYAPFIDVRFEPRRAVFVQGEWHAILQRNGISDANLQSRVATDLPAILVELELRTENALRHWGGIDSRRLMKESLARMRNVVHQLGQEPGQQIADDSSMGVYWFDVFSDEKNGKSSWRATYAVKERDASRARGIMLILVEENIQLYANPRVWQKDVGTINLEDKHPTFEESDRYKIGCGFVRLMGYRPIAVE